MNSKIEGQEVAASLILRHQGVLESALVLDNSPNGLGMVTKPDLVATQQRAYLVGANIKQALLAF